MSRKLFKEGITVLKACKRSGIKISELSIHLETLSGEILELDMEIDEHGDMIKEYNKFDTEEEYDAFLDSEDELDDILYN